VLVQQKVLVVTDNHYLFRKFKSLLNDLNLDVNQFDFACTSSQTELSEENLYKIDITKGAEKLIGKYSTIFSLHCKKVFPPELVRSVKCINIHPGYNPYNRGWYPQVFSIINKLPVGATIHEMDEQIDHGKIIAQKEIKVNSWDTSLDIYNRILELEIELIKVNLNNILNNNYRAVEPEKEGNYNSIRDFTKFLEIDLSETGTAEYFIDRLRALSHGHFKNAFFKDPATGAKIFVKLELEKE
jgi:methionyl-tRNA formyltransferase